MLVRAEVTHGDTLTVFGDWGVAGEAATVKLADILQIVPVANGHFAHVTTGKWTLCTSYQQQTGTLQILQVADKIIGSVRYV